MTDEQRQDERMLEWLEAGPRDVPVEPLEAAVAYARAHPRRRLSWAGLRRYVMTRMNLAEVQPEPPKRRWGPALAAVAAVAVVAVVVVGGVGLLGGSGDGEAGGGVVPSASASATPTAVPSGAPTAAPEPTPMVGSPSCTVATLAGKAGEVAAVDGTGATARFSQRFGTGAVDAAGDLYVVDADAHAIRKVTPDGVVTTYAGKLGEAGSADGDLATARFNDPVALAIGRDGTMYVADAGNHTIRTITPGGTVTTLAGTVGESGRVDGARADARFAGLWSIAVDAAGTVYVGEEDSGAIRTVTPDGTVTTIAGQLGRSGVWEDGAGPAARLGFAFGMAVGPDGTLYFADVNASRTVSVLRTVAPDGTVATIDADWTPGQPAKLWVDKAGVAYVTSYINGTVLRMTPEGTVTVVAGETNSDVAYRDGPGDVARFGGPLGIYGDDAGTLYVADTESATLRTVRCP